jgi:hypothetical protein
VQVVGDPALYTTRALDLDSDDEGDGEDEDEDEGDEFETEDDDDRRRRALATAAAAAQRGRSNSLRSGNLRRLPAAPAVVRAGVVVWAREAWAPTGTV